MKKTTKKVTAFLLASTMGIAMVGTAFAYDPSVNVNIKKSGNSLKFSAEVRTDAPANFVDDIYLSTESINEDTGNVISAWDGSKSGRSRLASGYTKWAYGKIDYISGVPGDGYSDTVSTYYQNSRSANYRLIAQRDKAIASSFEIDLSGYKILNPPEKEYFDKGLLQTRKQANVQPGDTVPITYINENESKAYVIKQDAYGIDFMYEFENHGGNWDLIFSDKNNGTVMAPSIQSQLLKLRDTKERELDISVSDFLNE